MTISGRTLSGNLFSFLCALLILSLSIPAAEAGEKQVDLRRYYPADALFAGAGKIRDMEETLAKVESMIQAVAGDEGMQGYNEGIEKINADLGIDLKSELANLTGQSGIVLDINDVDALLSAANQDQAAGLQHVVNHTYGPR